MGKLNTNGNAYTIIYASVMVIIVAFLLAFVASSLKPTQDANEANDKKSQILAALGVDKDSQYDVQAKYKELIRNDRVYGNNPAAPAKNGEQADQDGFKVPNKELSPTNRPLYIAEVDGQIKYVIPMTGAGLWGGIWGYVALDDDCETVFGTYFSHESETAGLGARITEKWFQDLFKGKKLHAADKPQEVALSVVKKGKEGSLSPDNYVNAVTGATLTSNGVDEMIKKGINMYADILEQLKKSKK